MTLPRRPSHEPYRVYSEREFLRLVKCEPQLGWTRRPTVGADSLRRETCSRAAGATTVDWQKIGLLSTAMLASAIPAAAADPLSGKALYDDVLRYDGFGPHRYGSAGATQAFDWIANELAPMRSALSMLSNCMKPTTAEPVPTITAPT